jgi:uncharacterized protein YggE
MALALSGCGPAIAAQAAGNLQQATGTDQPPVRTLAVNGTGKAYLTPDIAYIYIGVQTENADAAEAVAENNTKAQKVVDAIKAFKIEAKDIQTTNFSIFPQQQYDENGKLTGVIYMVNNTVYVTLRDIEKVGEVIDAAVTAGANTINNIQFDVEDKAEALSEARKAAVADARRQAEELATAVDVSLGAVQSMSSYTSGMPVPMYEGKGGGGVFADQAAAAPVSAGQLVVQVDVSIVYAIE